MPLFVMVVEIHVLTGDTRCFLIHNDGDADCTGNCSADNKSDRLRFLSGSFLLHYLMRFLALSLKLI